MVARLAEVTRDAKADYAMGEQMIDLNETCE